MKRSLLFIVVLFVIGWQAPAAPSLAQSSEQIKKIEAGLLTTPDQCGTPCVWNFQPGKQTVADFRTLAAAFVPEVSKSDAHGAVEGIHTAGVSLHMAAIDAPQLSSAVDYLYVRAVPEEVSAAGIKIDGFTPAAMIKSLGKPTEAYLLFNKAQVGKSNRFRLFMVYTTQNVIYVMTGAFQDGKACLTPESADTLTLYRFGSTSTLDAYLRKFASNKDTLPATISVTTNQTVNDFLRMAQNPAADCLTLK